MPQDNIPALQVILAPASTIKENQARQRMALFNDAGVSQIVPQNGGQLPFTPIVVAGAIGTAAKTTTTAEPTANTLVLLKFTSGNSAASPTVAFAGGSARAIQLGGAASAAIEVTLAANGIGLFFFDGTILHQVGVLS